MQLYTPDSVYKLDRAAVAQDGIAEIDLMRRAGESLWRAILARWPEVSKITVFAGAGNNGGDAFVVALCARAQSVEVQLLVQGDLTNQSDSSRHFSNKWLEDGNQLDHWSQQILTGELIVDGLLGIGLTRELDSNWQQLIYAINEQAVPRVAIDIPSGLNAMTGNPQPVAVRADLTVTFIGIKTGQFLAQGPDYCGELLFEDLGLSTAARDSVTPALQVIEQCQLPGIRKQDSHKFDYGHLLVVGGAAGMSGAVLLAARAALRSGAGLVTALLHPDCDGHFASVPEIMVRDWNALDEVIDRASVVLVGPGLGNSKATRELLRALQVVELPMVVDADALDIGFLQALQSTQAIITPHPGEAARLLSCTSAEIQANRIDACRKLVEGFAVTCILKGSGSLIASDAGMHINIRGNPGMASAGMGDVLGGIIAALVAQGMSGFEAARSAVYIHALCAEHYAEDRDQTGLISSDIIELIPLIIKQIRGRKE